MYVCWERVNAEGLARGLCCAGYKGKGNKSECGSYRGISMMSVVGKLYGRVVIDRFENITEGLVREEQGGFRKGRGCVDQVFAVKGLYEKYGEKGWEIYLGFIDLEKAYDRIDREALWRVVMKSMELMGDY